MTLLIPVIMCGGIGSRLWPTSRELAPKQLQPIIDGQSLLAHTLMRLESLRSTSPPLIICGANYAKQVQDILDQSGVINADILAEPMGRDTAATAILAALWARDYGGQNARILLMPADHFITASDAFAATIDAMASAASAGFIATAGIKPTHAETGYGYIRRQSAPLRDTANTYPVDSFVEKPDLKTATKYFNNPHYSWNSGMFAFAADIFLDEAEHHAGDIYQPTCTAWEGRASLLKTTTNSFCFSEQKFSAIPKSSIDYAIMEHTTKASVSLGAFHWQDVGSWASVHAASSKDKDGNVLHGDIITHDTRDSLIKSSSNRVIATIGVQDIAIIDTPDALLITRLQESQTVKSIYQRLGNESNAFKTSTTQHHGPGSPSWALAIRQKARAWFFDKCLPYWSDVGLDKKHGGAVEALDHTGRPLHRPKRVMVQARQAYVFAHASLLGFNQGIEAMRAPLEFMLRFGNPEGGRFIHLMGENGAVKDAHANAYDHAFVIFALAWCWRVTGEDHLKAKALETLRFMQTQMRHNAGGYVEALPDQNAPYRRANPHMHLLEAALTWVEFSQDEAFLDLAHEMVQLFDSNFTKDGLLWEYFTGDLKHLRDDTPKKWRALEPGHLYEWTYLLRQYQTLTGKSHNAQAVLEAFADSYGHCENTRLVLDQIMADGSRFENGTSRLWPQTEFMRLKYTKGTAKDKRAALEKLDTFMNVFLTIDGEMPGWWYDKFDHNGKVASGFSPASSLYHIVGAFSCVIDEEGRH